METTTLNRSEVISYKGWTIETETNPYATTRGVLFNYYKGEQNGQKMRSAASLEDAKEDIDEMVGEDISDDECIANYMGEIGLTKVKDDKIVPYKKSYTIWQNIMPVFEKINSTAGYDAIHIDKDAVWLHVSGLKDVIQFSQKDYPSLISRIYAAVVEYVKIKSVIDDNQPIGSGDLIY